MTIEIGGADHRRQRAVTPAPAAPSGPPTPTEPVDAHQTDPSPVPVAAPVAERDSQQITPTDWVRALQEVQRQTSEAHATFQQSIANAHLAYLHAAEVSMHGLAAALGDPHTPLPALSELPTGLPSRTPPALPAPAGSRDTEATGPAREPATAEPEPARYPQPVNRVPAATPAPTPPRPRVPEQASQADPEPVEIREATVVAMPTNNTANSDTESLPTETDLLSLALETVADCTGHPGYTLNADTDLEAELGVDQEKQAEILDELRRRLPGLPRLGGLVPERLTTVRHLVDQLCTGSVPAARRSGREASSSRGTGGESPDSATEGEPAGPVETVEPVEPPLRRLTARLVPAVAPGLAPAGLHLHPVVVTGGPDGVARRLATALRARGVRASAVGKVPANARAVVHLAGLTAPRTAEQAFAAQREVFQTAREFGGQYGAGGGLFVIVQDTGGRFGLGQPSEHPRVLLGGLAALARTAALEWPEVVVRGVDCAWGDRPAKVVAAALAEEICQGGTDSDVGLLPDGSRLRREILPAEPLTAAWPGIEPDTLVVVTGGARGVPGRLVRELARAWQPKLALLGRTQLVDEDPELAAAVDETVLRALLTRRAALEPRRPSPAALTRYAERLLASREVRATVRELRGLGVPVEYHSVDVTDGVALRQTLTRVRAELGPPGVLVHAAGLVRPKLICDKTDDQFDEVFRAKVHGLRALLEATAADPIELVALCSAAASWTGEAGHCDHAMANQVAEELLHAHRARRPERQVRSVAWGAWQRPGTDPVEPGVDPDAAAEAFVAELGQEPTAHPRSLLVPGTAQLPARPGLLADGRSVSEIAVSRATAPQLADRPGPNGSLVPVALILEWFLRAAGPGGGEPAAPVTVYGFRLERPVRLPGFPDGEHRLLVTVDPPATEPDPGATRTVRLQAPDSTEYARAELADQPPRQIPLLADPDPTGPPPETDPYRDPALARGPMLRAMREVHSLELDGAVTTVTNLTELGWPGSGWRTDPAMVDGGLQSAALWTLRQLGIQVEPVAVTEYRVYRPGPADRSIRCVVWPRQVAEARVVCDILLADCDGRLRAELLGVELVAAEG